jgi:hypothetical protein
LVPAILDVLEDDFLADRICLYPERRFIQQPGGGIMRFWEENWSGDDWWDVQVRIFMMCNDNLYNNLISDLRRASEKTVS